MEKQRLSSSEKRREERLCELLAAKGHKLFRRRQRALGPRYMVRVLDDWGEIHINKDLDAVERVLKAETIKEMLRASRR
jgi:hypothetical protein